MRFVFFANTDWYLYNFRRSLAVELGSRGHDVLLISPHGPYGSRLQSLGFRWVAAPMVRRSLNPIRELFLIAWLARCLRRERADLIHAFTIKPAIYGSLAARLAGVRASANAVAGMGYVFTSDDVLATALRPAVRALMRLAFDDASARLILQNEDDLAWFRAQRVVDNTRIRLIPGSGVDLKRFSPGAADRGSGQFRVLLAARLLWDKGVGEFVEAARRLKSSGAAAQFLLAGNPDPGNPAAVPEAAIRGWEREGLVEWLGHVDDMPALLSTVHAVVLPSYREGLPKTLIEAAACGLPLVTTNAPGCREVVTHGVDGLLVPVRDAGALAAAIAMLESDPDLAARLGAAAKNKALEYFDERIVIEKTLSVYRELLGDSV